MQYPISALQMLILFTEKRILLTQKDYDDYFDSVLAALEKANDETYRLQDKSEVLP